MGSGQDIGVVVIGRNERPRLAAALQSIPRGTPLVFVDSGSTDGSAELALSLGVTVHRVDTSRPMSAARARNEGFEVLRRAHRDLQIVQFLDGDCVLDAQWLERVRQAMAADPARALVVGTLIERHPDASIYNRMCSMEWQGQPGELSNWGAIGGIMAVRCQVFAAMGGFNAEVIAGEDSELGVRIGLAGHKLLRLAEPMATHDANLQHFGQWWKRCVRSGHAIAQRYSLNGKTRARDCAREYRSTLVWGLSMPVVALVLAWPTQGWSLALLAAAYLWLIWRVMRYRRSLGNAASDAWLYAALLALGKFAEAKGLLAFHLAQRRGRYRLIEYK